MNAHALLDWFAIRCCRNAQHEIRDLAWKMLRLCRGAAPDLFEGAGPNCVQLGYCPENNLQNARCKGRIITKDEALAVLRERSAKGKPARWGEAAWSNAAWSGSTLEAAPPSDSEFEEE